MNQRLKRFYRKNSKNFLEIFKTIFCFKAKPSLILIQNKMIRKKLVHRILEFESCGQIRINFSFLFRLTLLEAEYIITEKGVKNEKNVSAFKNQKGEGPRFQKKEQDQRRQKGLKTQKNEKKKKIDREDQRERMKKEGFPKSLKIKNKKEWDEVIKKGERSFTHNLLLLSLKTAEKGNKFGITLSSALKGAVKRNRIKRVLREILRRNKDRFLPGEKVILIYRSKEKEISYHEISNEFLGFFESKKS